MSGAPLNPSTISASGLTFRGIQLNYQTPYTQGYNLTGQYQLTQHDSVEAGYVGSQARHLEASTGENNVFEELPPGTPLTGYVSSPGATPQNFIPFPHWGAGSPTSVRPAIAAITRFRPNGRTAPPGDWTFWWVTPLLRLSATQAIRLATVVQGDIGLRASSRSRMIRDLPRSTLRTSLLAAEPMLFPLAGARSP